MSELKSYEIVYAFKSVLDEEDSVEEFAEEVIDMVKAGKHIFKEESLKLKKVVKVS